MDYQTIQDIVHDLEANPAEDCGDIYHPIPFCEFDHLKTSTIKSEALKKLQLIENICEGLFPEGLLNRKLLDVGANAGLYTFSLAMKGMLVTAFEPHKRYGKIGKFLAKDKMKNVLWYDIPFDKNIVAGNKFDITLMMSVFQWMAKGGSNLLEAAEKLKFISEISNYLIFELGFNTGWSCIKTKKVNHYAHLIHFLRNHTVYNYFKLICRTCLWGRHHKRFLVLCSHNRYLDDSIFQKLIRCINV